MPGRAGQQGTGGRTAAAAGSVSIASPVSTLDELLKQVELLKLSNARLQSELAGGASHVTRLEREAAQRRDVLRLLRADRDGSELRASDGGSASSGGGSSRSGSHHQLYHVGMQVPHNHSSVYQQQPQQQDANCSVGTAAAASRGSPADQRAVAASATGGSAAGSPRASNTSRSLTGSPARQAAFVASASYLLQQQQQQQMSQPGSDPSSAQGSPVARRGSSALFSGAVAPTKRDQVAAAPMAATSAFRSATGLTMAADSERRAVAATEQLRLPSGSGPSATSFSGDIRSSGACASRDDSFYQPAHRGFDQANDFDQKSKKDKRDSGTYDHAELEKDGVLLCDASTNTNTTLGEVFVSKPSFDLDRSCSESGLLGCGPRGTAVVTIGTQTAEMVAAALSATGSSGGNATGRTEGSLLGAPTQAGSAKHSLASVYHGAWPIGHGGRWGCGSGSNGSSGGGTLAPPETQSVMSFQSATSGSHRSGSASGKSLSTVVVQTPDVVPADSEVPAGNNGSRDDNERRPLAGSKVDVMYSLLSMLGTHDPDDASRTLLAMSNSPDSCVAMRHTGCLTLIVQLLHGVATDASEALGGSSDGAPKQQQQQMCGGAVGRARRAARARAARALRNIVRSHPDERRGYCEARVLHNLEVLRRHCDRLAYQMHSESDNADSEDACSSEEDDSELADIYRPNSAQDYDEVTSAVSSVMKLSFDEESRQAICNLGGLQALAEFMALDTSMPGSFSDACRVTLRRYVCMSLTNLTFGDSINKTVLCSIPGCLRVVVQQLQGFNEDLCQVAASVLRNLSWRADRQSKIHLRQSGATRRLSEAALLVRKESSLKSILSALWNLSAHCSENKVDICAVDGALPFLVGALSYRSPSKTLSIIESAGGVLRNVSSVVAVREDLRRVLREHDFLRVLLTHLRSPSLTVVGNACGALWNISARCREDQAALREMGAIEMLRSLVTSKHRQIATGAAAALKNLLTSEHRAAATGVPGSSNHGFVPSTKGVQEQCHGSPGGATPLCEVGGCGSSTGTGRTSLAARRLRQARDELVCEEMSDTCDNLEACSPPTCSPLGQRRHLPASSPLGATASAMSGSSSGHSLSSALGTGERTTAMSDATGSRNAKLAGSKSMTYPYGADGQPPMWQSLDGRMADCGSASAGRLEKSVSEDSMGSAQGVADGDGAGRRTSDPSSARHSPQLATTAIAATTAPFARSATSQSTSKLEQLMKEVMDANRMSNVAPGPLAESSLLSHSFLPSSSSLSSSTSGVASGRATAGTAATTPTGTMMLSNLTAGRSVFRNSGSTAGTGSVGSGGTVSDFSSLSSSAVAHSPRYGLMIRDQFSVNPALSPRVTKTTAATPVTVVQDQQQHLLQPAMSLLGSYLMSLAAGLPTMPPAALAAAAAAAAAAAGQPTSAGGAALALGAAGLLYSPILSSAAALQQQYCTGGSITAALSPPSAAAAAAPDLSSPRSAGSGSLAHCHGGGTEDDDDNCSEKPVDYSRRYTEHAAGASGYDQKASAIAAAALSAAPTAASTTGGTSLPSQEGTASGTGVAGASASSFDCKAAEDDVFCEQDQLKTFCTEGTPMNFLSTATSMNELNKVCFGNGGGDEAAMGVLEEEEAAVDRPPSSADSGTMSQHAVAASGGVDRMLSGSQPVLSGEAPLASREPGSSAGQQQQPPPTVLARRLPSEAGDDGPVVYATEDTPLSFSRVSSLSNLSSGVELPGRVHERSEKAAATGAAIGGSTNRTAAGAGGPAALLPPLCLQVISEHDVQTGTSVASLGDRQDSAEKLASSTLQSDDRHQHQHQQHHHYHQHHHVTQHKTVTFSEKSAAAAAAAAVAAATHETPMMFSRASSLNSLSSFDVQSVHSSVISEYSRRASEVVSPSDLPDSPGDTSPPAIRLIGEASGKQQSASKQTSAGKLLPVFSFQSRVHGLVSFDARPPLAANTCIGSRPAHPAASSPTPPRNITAVAAALPPLASATSSAVAAASKAEIGSARSRITVATYLEETDLMRPFAEEGTPDDRSVRSGLSALTFADDELEAVTAAVPPPPPVPPRVPRLYANLRSTTAVTMPVDDVKSAPAGRGSGTSTSASAGLAETAAAAAVSLAEICETAVGTPRTAGGSEVPPAVETTCLPAGELPHSASVNDSFAKKLPAVVESDGPRHKEGVASGRDVDALSVSSSSSEGDEDMLAKCISSALPVGGRRSDALSMRKSASDHAVGRAGKETTSGGAGRQSSATAASALGSASSSPAASQLPRSKTFGSKLRVPLSKDKSRRRRQAAAVAAATGTGSGKTVAKVGANSPTPDDDQLLAAEDCLRTFATEDTPNNFSTATSLSDLSVLDDPRESMASFSGGLATGSHDGLDASSGEREPGGLSTSEDDSDSEDSDSDDADDDDVLSRAISSAFPKRAGSRTGDSLRPATMVQPTAPAFGSAQTVYSQRTAAVGCEDFGGASSSSTRTAREGAGGSGSAIPAASSGPMQSTSFRSMLPRPQAVPTTAALGDATRPPAAAVSQLQQRSMTSPSSTSGTSLKSTSNELRPGDLKPTRCHVVGVAEVHRAAATADSVREYATEGTPRNFSNSTSLSDLTVDSHYSAGPARTSSAGGSFADRLRHMPAPAAASAAASKATEVCGQDRMMPTSQNAAQPLGSDAFPHRRHGQHQSLQLRQQYGVAADSRQHGTTADGGDSVRAYNLEGTPFSYSRRDSLSSLSCDENESCDGGSRTGRQREAESGSASHGDALVGGGSCLQTSAADCELGASSGLTGVVTDQTASHRRVPVTCSSSGAVLDGVEPAAAETIWHQPLSGFAGGSGGDVCGNRPVTGDVTDGSDSRPPPLCQSRDEELLKFTPVEGTPYCYSRCSPLSSLSSHDEEEEENRKDNVEPPPADCTGQHHPDSGLRHRGASAGAEDETLHSIDEAHRAESLASSTGLVANRQRSTVAPSLRRMRTSSSDSSCSSEGQAASDVSIDSFDDAGDGSAFLDQCIASAMPQKFELNSGRKEVTREGTCGRTAAEAAMALSQLAAVSALSGSHEDRRSIDGTSHRDADSDHDRRKQLPAVPPSASKPNPADDGSNRLVAPTTALAAECDIVPSADASSQRQAPRRGSTSQKKE